MRQICTIHAISAEPKDVIDSIWSGAEWNARWAAIRHFNVRYDDGTHQIAEIALLWDGNEVHMEVVRFRTRPDCIEFFCPRPPHPLIHQSGRWAVETHSGRKVLVALRNIDLAENPGESGTQFQLRLDGYTKRLIQRLSLILPRFASGAVMP